MVLALFLSRVSRARWRKARAVKGCNAKPGIRTREDRADTSRIFLMLEKKVQGNFK